jgi:hypothetical protein
MAADDMATGDRAVGEVTAVSRGPTVRGTTTGAGPAKEPT